MSFRRFATCVLIGALVAAGIGFLIYSRPRESAIERAHRLCGVCFLLGEDFGGLTIDDIIDDLKDPTLSREENLAILREAVSVEDDPAKVELCQPCIEAIVDAMED